LPVKRKEGRFPFRKALILLFTFIFIIGGVASYFILPKAEIKIWPESESISLETELLVSQAVYAPQYPDQVIPGTIFEAEKTIVEEFSSLGSLLKEEEAEGMVRIYNECSTLQVLISDTRLQPPLEKFNPPLEENKGEKPWFRTTKRVAVAADSFVDVSVIADSPGSKYNIEPSTFSIPGLVGTSMYTCVYGKSFKTMTGGLLDRVPQVTEEDLEKAEEATLTKIESEAKTALAQKIPSGFILSKDSIQTEILESSSSVKVGEETEKFTFRAKALSKVLAFREKDLEDFVKALISSRLSSHEKLYEASLHSTYLPVEINLKSGKLLLHLTAEAKIYADIDTINLRKALREKSLSEAKIFLKNYPSITKTEVNLWPFWVKRVPGEEDKIFIELRVD